MANTGGRPGLPTTSGGRRPSKLWRSLLLVASVLVVVLAFVLAAL